MKPIVPQTSHVEWSFIQISPFDFRGAIARAPGRMGSRMGVEWDDTPSKSNGNQFDVETNGHALVIPGHIDKASSDCLEGHVPTI